MDVCAGIYSIVRTPAGRCGHLQAAMWKRSGQASQPRFCPAYHVRRRLPAAPTLTITRTLTMLTAIFDNLPNLSLPDIFDFDLTVHIHVER